MTSKLPNPAPLAKAAGLRNVDQRAADDNRATNAKQPTLQQAADQFVTEMVRLGASFEVTRSAAGTSWRHHCRPGTRQALRRYKSRVDLNRPGFHEAIVRAILRIQFVGAP